jgi:hypothetical protein
MVTACKFCNIELTELNRSGKRKSCKPCRSKEVIEFQKKNSDWRKKYANEYARKTGKVKEYPCEVCNKLCYKKYAKAFCSDRCRFMSHVEITNQCWLWKSGKNRRGYGKSNKGSKMITAHRLSYELFIDEIPDGLFVCHTCDIPSCVRPAHLWLGTTQDNKFDQLEKDRGGKKLNTKNVIQIRKLSNEGMGSQKIAYLFNVSCSAITNIIKRRIWKHV